MTMTQVTQGIDLLISWVQYYSYKMTELSFLKFKNLDALEIWR